MYRASVLVKHGCMGVIVRHFQTLRLLMASFRHNLDNRLAQEAAPEAASDAAEGRLPGGRAARSAVAPAVHWPYHPCAKNSGTYEVLDEEGLWPDRTQCRHDSRGKSASNFRDDAEALGTVRREDGADVKRPSGFRFSQGALPRKSSKDWRLIVFTSMRASRPGRCRNRRAMPLVFCPGIRPTLCPRFLMRRGGRYATIRRNFPAISSNGLIFGAVNPPIRGTVLRAG